MQYVAFFRGISPANPAMSNKKLMEVCSSFGFEKIWTVLSSGNVLFETRSSQAKTFETKIENALKKQLGLTTTVIIRSLQQIQQLVKRDPFQGMVDSGMIRLNVTFLKDKPHTDTSFPYQSSEKTFCVLGICDGAVCSIVDLAGARTPDLMIWLEKEFGSQITTRRWNTVLKILASFQEQS